MVRVCKSMVFYLSLYMYWYHINITLCFSTESRRREAWQHGRLLGYLPQSPICHGADEGRMGIQSSWRLPEILQWWACGIVLGSAGKQCMLLSLSPCLCNLIYKFWNFTRSCFNACNNLCPMPIWHLLEVSSLLNRPYLVHKFLKSLNFLLLLNETIFWTAMWMCMSS